MKLLALALLLASAPLRAEPSAPFPFMPPWDDASPGVTDLSGLLEKPAGLHGFVAARDGHLYAGEKRIRFFGVNMAFGANFPSHEDAPKIAARMAKFGINCVRFHHMDNQSVPTGIWSTDKLKLDAGQLDRLDFFIAQLKTRGIYANLNLHVSRIYPGMPEWEGAKHYDKGVDLFYPPMIEMQRDYARQLLRHVNPYTGKAYADDPAVAIVEINNENGLIHEWQGAQLDNLPEPYRAELQKQWNEWLKSKYGTPEALAKAWSADDAPPGEELLRDGDFSKPVGTVWNLEHHQGAEAAATNVTSENGQAVEVKVRKPGTASWHVQLGQAGIELKEGTPYTLRFRASSPDGPRQIRVAASQAHAPWEVLWSGAVRLEPGEKEYHLAFRLNAGDKNARIVFGEMGLQPGRYRFAGVSLRSGGVFGLQEGEALGSVPPLRKDRFFARSPEAQRDWMRFLWKTEEDYWTGMDRFLKEEIKTRSVIVGTAVGYSPAGIQAKLDAVDTHAYWQHPRFPGHSWDPANWTVENIPMAGVPGGGELPGCAFDRVAGKPFLCTEYNAPAPNAYSAEAFLLLNAYAALQDWDGVFAFAYSHRLNDWNPGKIPGFFDIDQHPAKMVTLPTANALFLRGDLSKSPATATAWLPAEKAIAAAVRGDRLNAKTLGFGPNAWIESAVQLETGAKPPEFSLIEPAAKVKPQIVWDKEHALVTIDTPRNKAFIGRGTGEPATLGEVQITPSKEWSAIAVTAMDGADFKSPGRVLITAAGNVENTAMGWKNPEKTSVGRDWGTPPALAWGVEARVALPVPASRLRAWALDERGQRGEPLAVEPGENGGVLHLDGSHRTLWYEVEIAK